MKRQVLFSSFIGNALEFYDFTICGVFLAKLSTVFFPTTDPNLALFGSFFAFSAAFWTRPLGAFLFGYIGDRFGRKKALVFSIGLMAFPTLIIGLLPSFEKIGYAAPIILIGCRMLQGLCTGGEYNGAAIFTLEHFGKLKAGVISGLISASCALGALLATFAGGITNAPYMPDWAWRVPFILGAIIGTIGVYTRRRIGETEEYLSLHVAKKQTTPVMQIWKNLKLPFLLSTIIGATNGALSYTLFAFLNIYLNRYVGVKIFEGIFYNIFGLGMMFLMCPVFGGLSDQITPRRSIYLSSLLILMVTPISFYFMQMGNFASIFVGQLILGTVVASFLGPCHAFMQNLFPTETRYTGVALGFSIGMAFAGGTTPMMLTYLIDATQNLYMPVIVLIFYATVTAVLLRISLIKNIGNKQHFHKQTA